MVNIPVFTGFHTCWVVGLGISEPSTVGTIYFISHWKTKDPLVQVAKLAVSPGTRIVTSSTTYGTLVRLQSRGTGKVRDLREIQWRGEEEELSEMDSWNSISCVFFGVKLTLKQNFVSFFWWNDMETKFRDCFLVGTTVVCAKLVGVSVWWQIPAVAAQKAEQNIRRNHHSDQWNFSMTSNITSSPWA